LRIERSRSALAQVRSLDDTLAVQRREDEINVRWKLVHMVEATERHAGHLDNLLDAARYASS
jgi:hypothetical protein